MTTLTPEQIDEIKELHVENADMLLELVNGHVNMDTPKPITHPDASCLIAKVIYNNTKMLEVINEAEEN